MTYTYEYFLNVLSRAGETLFYLQSAMILELKTISDHPEESAHTKLIWISNLIRAYEEIMYNDGVTGKEVAAGNES